MLSPIAHHRDTRGSTPPPPKRLKSETYVEEEEAEDRSSSSDDDSEDDDLDEEDIRLFNEQFLKSDGFDPDFSKFRYVNGQRPVDLNKSDIVCGPETNLGLLTRLSKVALAKHNEDEKKSLVFVKVVKANYHVGTGLTIYITFEVHDPLDGRVKPYQAMVGYLPVLTNVYLCRPKPCP